MDPITVLSAGLHSLQVGSVPTTNSEPTTPSTESPLSLDASLREWLTDTLVANSTSANPKVYTKLLVSNAAAGSVIGKAGANINDVQARTYARIQLSKANEYFPGTTERTLLVTGRLKQVVAALSLIFAKLLREGVAPLSPKSKAAAAFPPPAAEGEEEAEARPLRLLVRLLVPQPLCGVIIGKNGVTIRNYAADTNTVIRVTSSEAAQSPTSHRIVTIAGEKEGVLKAIALMTLKQSDDPKYPMFEGLPSPAMPRGGYGGAALPPQFMAHPTPSPFMPPTGPPGVYGGGAGLFSMLPLGMAGPAAGDGGYTSLSLVLTEDQAAVLLDGGSRAVVDVEQMSGCRARLDMSDGPRGPFGRLLLAGTRDTLAYAQWLLGQRLAQPGFQVAGTTYYTTHSPPGPGFVAPPMAAMPFMAGPWQSPGVAPQQQAPTLQQQQHLMAAAGMMPAPLALRQHSGSSAATP
ncbi:RNA-binding Nova-1 [Micractinium conductrix]|uniref:RNA-binding Nova-1 n=1 Tax=Micractinium conductrix TaxID=554055 RepID=A0A2P6V939_9CHLO|nr:RNA-binding Nova-1 [Micractinium conductrix]|eukprot:PSC70603.1 RNA-binding Nova-1 [Micractinium conductrix]